MPRVPLLFAVAALATACAGADEEKGPRLASGDALPECQRANPPPGATATFVANGHAWAMRPDGRGITCLFEVSDSSAFAWGPRGDRALLARLEVRGLAGAPSRPASDVRLAAASWGRPIGKSIVFVGRSGRSLLKAHMGRPEVENVTPIRGARYREVVYRPSGLALAFVVRRRGDDAIWISTNTGREPRQLVWSRTGARLGALAFTADGRQLVYAAQHARVLGVLHHLDLERGGVGTLWTAPETRIRALRTGPARRFIGLTTGASCSSERALVYDFAAGKPRPLLPRETRATRVVGWLDGRTLLVGVGGCGTALELRSVDVRTSKDTRLATGVEAAATRLPEPSPPPPLPSVPKVPGSGFA